LPSTGSRTLTKTPGGTTSTGTGTGTTISGLTAGTYTWTVTNSAGCTSPSSADVVINSQPATPTAPTVGTITHPTCSSSTGSVVLNGLPATGSWTVTKAPGGTTLTGTGNSTTISGLTTGTYTYTVTNTSGCTSSASSDIIINTQPVVPGAPSVGLITQPTCTVPTGSVVLNGLPTPGTWTLTKTPGGITNNGSGSSSTVSGLPTGTYTYNVTNSAGCISVASANIVINTVKTGLIPKIKIKWNDVIFCLNRADSVLSYMWYKGTSVASGTKNTGRYYITNKQPGIYKLQTTDKDGCVNFSSTITISTGAKSLSVYPNPASENFALSLTDETLGKAVISIINLTGKKVMELITEKEFPDLYKVIPTSDLSEGTYVIRVVINQEYIYYSKIVVIK